MSHSRADGIAATNDRTCTGILTLEETVVTAYASVLLTTVHVSPTAGLLYTEAVLAGVKHWALRRVLALGIAGAAHADLIVQTLSGGRAGRRTDSKAAQHACRALLLSGTELQLCATQCGIPSEARTTEAAGNMAGCPALSVLTTDIGQTTDIHALIADAGAVSRTVRVGDTFKWNTSNTGVALGSRRA